MTPKFRDSIAKVIDTRSFGSIIVSSVDRVWRAIKSPGAYAKAAWHWVQSKTLSEHETRVLAEKDKVALAHLRQSPQRTVKDRPEQILDTLARNEDFFEIPCLSAQEAVAFAQRADKTKDKQTKDALTERYLHEQDRWSAAQSQLWRIDACEQLLAQVKLDRQGRPTLNGKVLEQHQLEVLAKAYKYAETMNGICESWTTLFFRGSKNVLCEKYGTINKKILFAIFKTHKDTRVHDAEYWDKAIELVRVLTPHELREALEKGWLPKDCYCPERYKQYAQVYNAAVETKLKQANLTEGLNFKGAKIARVEAGGHRQLFEEAKTALNRLLDQHKKHSAYIQLTHIYSVLTQYAGRLDVKELKNQRIQVDGKWVSIANHIKTLEAKLAPSDLQDLQRTENYRYTHRLVDSFGATTDKGEKWHAHQRRMSVPTTSRRASTSARSARTK